MGKRKPDTEFIRKYWRKVVSLAFSPSWESAEMKYVTLFLFTLLSLTAIASLLVALGLVSVHFFAERINNVRGGVLAFVVSILIFVVIFMSKIYRVPADLHYKQEEQLLSLKNQLNGVNFKVILSANSESYLGRQIVYLIAENQGNIDLKDCYAYLSKLEYKLINNEQEKKLSGKDYRVIDVLIFNNLNKNKLPWPAFDVSAEKVIRAGYKGRVNITTIENEKLVFLFENENSNKYTKPGEYYLEVEFGGSANGKQIKRKVFRGILRYVIRDNEHQIYLHPANDKDKSHRTKREPD